MDNDHLSRSILAFILKSYSLSWPKLLLIEISWYLNSDIRILWNDSAHLNGKVKAEFRDFKDFGTQCTKLESE